jgi:hypothetical protein
MSEKWPTSGNCRFRGRDASYLAPPAQIRTCGFSAYGSHLGYRRRYVAVCEPTPVSRLSGSESSACLIGPHSPWSLPFAPPTPRRIAPLCSSASQLLWQSQTSRVRSSSATAPHLPDAGRQRQCHSGQTRDLPASDAILLHVMWPQTPAGRQHLAWRCRTCCLRANENPRPLRYLIFRGSIPHPMQSLCTLRDYCRQEPRNTR